MVDLAGLTGGAPVLVLAPHPDDESLGCGGLIAACAAAGIVVAVALLTDGAGSHPGSASHPPSVLARLRADETRAALAELGVGAAALHELGWPDQAAPLAGANFELAVAQLVALARGLGAGSIVAAWAGDPHCDHVAGAAIAEAAARETGARLLSYPVWGWTLPEGPVDGGGAAVRLDVGAFLARKRRAIACHRSQFGLVVGDCPAGFVLPPSLLEACLTEYEVFFQAAA
jgi:LmbE family N-acetylglucosaminyl deacetylase